MNYMYRSGLGLIMAMVLMAFSSTGHASGLEQGRTASGDTKSEACSKAKSELPARLYRGKQTLTLTKREACSCVGSMDRSWFQCTAIGDYN